MRKRSHDLTDAYVDSVISMSRDDAEPIMLLDGNSTDAVRGLQLRIGLRKATWQFYSEKRIGHNDRIYGCKTLGAYDVGGTGAIVAGPRGTHPTWQRADWHVGVKDARRLALIARGDLTKEGKPPSTKYPGPTFAEAFDGGYTYKHEKTGRDVTVEGYLQYLRRTGKSDRWAYNVERLGEQFLKEKWSDYTLAEMADNPDLFQQWHVKIPSATSANHCSRVVRALFGRAVARDTRLAKYATMNPTRAVEMKKERREQKGMTARDFPTWYQQWQAIANATHRSFHLTNLLTSARPGELGRVRWRDYDRENDLLVIPFAKEENNIEIICTPEIHAAIKIARDDKARPADVGFGPDDLIWPGTQNNPTRDKLIARGHALRRTYRTVALDHCGVPDPIAEALLGHVPEGIKGRYILKWARAEGPRIVEAQKQISKTIMSLLRSKQTKKRAA